MISALSASSYAVFAEGDDDFCNNYGDYELYGDYAYIPYDDTREFLSDSTVPPIPVVTAEISHPVPCGTPIEILESPSTADVSPIFPVATDAPVPTSQTVSQAYESQ